MAVLHHQRNRHEFKQTSEDGKGQRGLVCCSPWGRKELDMAGPTEQQFHYDVIFFPMRFYVVLSFKTYLSFFIMCIFVFLLIYFN